MSLANYGGLVDAIGQWLDRADLSDRVPDFVRLTESRINRLLDDPDMEATATITASGNYTALPADFGEMVSISTGDGPLSMMGPVEFAGADKSIAGPPRFYSIVAQQIAFVPANPTAQIVMVYRRAVPALTASAPTNWLLTRAPDIYLYGALMQASAFLVEDSRAAQWKAVLDEAIEELRLDGLRRKSGSGPIAPRVRRA